MSFTIILSITLLSGPFIDLKANQIDISRSLISREKLYTDFSKVTRDLADLKKRRALELWISAIKQEDPGYLLNVYMQYRKVMKNKSLIDIMAHYFYVGDYLNYQRTVEFYYYSLAQYVLEFIQSPFYEKGNPHKRKAREIIRSQPFSKVADLRRCISNPRLYRQFSDKRSAIMNVKTSCIDKNPIIHSLLQFMRKLLNNEYYTKYLGPSFVTSYAGYIEGNHVQQLTQNRYDEEIISYLGNLKNKLLTEKNRELNKLYINFSKEDFKKVMVSKKDALTKLFTKAEGYPVLSSGRPAHEVYDRIIPGVNETNLFGEMFHAIRGAKKSIFFDVFFFGGSMGIYLAKQLIHQVQTQPDLYVYIITDRDNPFGYGKERDTVYNYLRAYGEKFPEDRIIILPANVTLKRTSLPDFIDLLVDDESLQELMKGETFKKYQDKVVVYPKAKSDHSKVFVIDGLDPQNGVAFVGSKNFTDASGSIAYDEMTLVKGPAVPIILDSYYYDLLEAMRLDIKKQPTYLKSFASQRGIRATNQETIIHNLLKELDVLTRYKGTNLSNFSYTWPKEGDAIIQIGQNNVYGTIRSPLEQDIHAILTAKKQVIISDQFLYDPTIVAALRRATLYNNKVDVYVIMASLEDPTAPEKPFNHVPNLVFLEDMMWAKRSDGKPKIEVKWKKVPETHASELKKVATGFGAIISPEYHIKALSVDGIPYDKRHLCGSFSNEKNVKVSPQLENQVKGLIEGTPILVSGSANKDNMTLLGGFREFQLLVFDKLASAKHDCLFWARWDDPTKSEPAKPFEVILPPALIERGMTPKAFVNILKTLLVNGYNFEEKVFE